MSEKKRFQVVVIGGGPGGYVAAIKAAQSGQSVALVEEGPVGGTCLNVGCIPTKALVANGDIWRKVQEAGQFGIAVEGASFNYAEMIARKNRVVTGIVQGLEGLIASNKIALFRGRGTFSSAHEIHVNGEDSAILIADKTIIATGSEPRDIAAFPFDGERVHSSTSILDVDALPRRLAVIGGGYIGCEFASLYRTLGVYVTILEMLPQILSTEGQEIGTFMRSAFERQGMRIETGVRVEGIDHTEDGLLVRLEGREPVETDLALVSVGRKLNSDNLGLDRVGVKVTPQGAIEVNERMETNIPDLYAIGDVTGKVLLAHVASHQGVVAATNATGGNAVMHYDAIPAVVFTHPEAASAGLSLEQAIEKGYDAKVAKFPFQVLGKSQAAIETDGFAQVVVDQKTHQILGAQVVGYEAGTLIAEMALAIHNELTLECVTETVHAHPTIPEAWMEAALLAGDMPIHLPPKRSRQ